MFFVIRDAAPTTELLPIVNRSKIVAFNEIAEYFPNFTFPPKTAPAETLEKLSIKQSC